MMMVLPRLQVLLHDIHTWPYADWQKKQQIADMLSYVGGQHVVFVNYTSHPTRYEDWVRNAADIDSSSVVWARMSNNEQNEAVHSYYQDRHFWILDLQTCQARFSRADPLFVDRPLGSVLLSWKRC
jgi:hypothetical protein